MKAKKQKPLRNLVTTSTSLDPTAQLNLLPTSGQSQLWAIPAEPQKSSSGWQPLPDKVCRLSVRNVDAQVWFCSNNIQPNSSTFTFHTTVLFISLFAALSRLVLNHQTACEQVPLNMLTLTHNTKALCCCDDFSLPPLIKCFAKLSEK